jgi:hypothetical protein
LRPNKEVFTCVGFRSGISPFCLSVSAVHSYAVVPYNGHDEQVECCCPARHRLHRPLAKSLPGQIQAVRQLLHVATQPASATELAKHFMRANADRIEEVLKSLVVTGNARRLKGSKYVDA